MTDTSARGGPEEGPAALGGPERDATGPGGPERGAAVPGGGPEGDRGDGGGAALSVRGLRFLLGRRRALARLVFWSVLETGQTFLMGYGTARALDDGFLRGRADTGLAWLAVTGAGVLIGAYGTARIHAALAALVEPLRDRLVHRVVSRGVRTGDPGTLSGLTQQVEIARDTFAGLVMVSRSFVFTAAGALAGLFALAPPLLLVVGPPLAAGVALFAVTLRPLARRQEAFLVADEALAGHLGTVCPGLRDVTATGAEAQVAAGTGERVEAELRAARALAHWGVLRVASLAVGGQLPIVLLLVTAPWLLDHGVTAGALVGALAYVTQSLLPALRNLVHGLGTSGSRLTVVLRRLSRADAPEPGHDPATARTQGPRPTDDTPAATPPSPESVPHQVPGPGSIPDRNPAPEAVPDRNPAPEAVPDHSSGPEAVPSRGPAPEAAPHRAPAPEAVPDHSSGPEAVPSRGPAPEAAPHRAPAPEAVPDHSSGPEAVPSRGPAPEAAPHRAPAPEAVPDRNPAPEAVPGCGPAPGAVPGRVPAPGASGGPVCGRTPAPRSRSAAAGAIAPAVELAGVTFAYGPASEPVVRGLDLTVPAGSHLAVVGPSGVGKSTLTALVAGLLTPRCGTIRVGGHPVPGPEAAAGRVLIPQEAYVFGGTLAENLAYLRAGPVPEEELRAASEAVGLAPLAARLGGLGARVDPASLSAGERQLIALTRAYLSDAPLALLDEATCHLDPGTEERAERAFARRPGGTLVVVAHRISSARRAGRVLVMDGRNSAHGRHEELMRTSALYRDLVGSWAPGPSRRRSEPALALRDADRVDAVAGPGLAGDGGHVVAHRPVGEVQASGDLRDGGSLGREG
ncbi:ATP-binding cassette domain-containing protein [Streptomyces sp. XY006]|uniref:ATP-binding cassette domain-containing protein n=1 Tax=Streptomyces sp. XY006 TaxID=2021410 RepID=UPI0026D7ECDA|nr:ATP-binding cassette domain-containing protein [Streptomyces sp. XY006]